MKKSRPRNVRLTIEYDGTAYSGWQVQAGRATVQGALADAIEKVTGKRSTVFGAGRTDAGVHALGQVANFRTDSRVPARKLAHALNAHLPADVTVVAAEDVDADFHSQFHATSKTYRYTILNRPTPAATRRLYTHLVRPPLDEAAMAAGAARLNGTHDFRAFGSEMSKKEKTIRTLLRAEVRREGELVVLEFEGDGFLYNQVRAMTGTLIEVGLGKHPPGWVREILETRDRRQAAANVPAKGLCLVSVAYGPRPPREATDRPASAARK